MSIHRCPECERLVDTDFEWVCAETDECERCCEARRDAAIATWMPLYKGERSAGLHDWMTEEGIAMRLREMGCTR